MPQIIPISELKNTNAISQMCHQNNEPIFITKNGYGDMVIMSIEMFEEIMYIQNVYKKLDESEKDVIAGRTTKAKDMLKSIRKKYNV